MLSLVAQDEDTFFLGTYGRVWKSIDQGQIWQERSYGISGMPVVLMLAVGVGRDVLLAGTPGNGLLRSDDGGERWARVKTGLSTAATYITAMVQGGDVDVVYLGTGGDGLYRSGDAGQTWQRVPGLSGIKEDISAIAVTPDDSVLWVAVSDGRLLRRRDDEWFETRVRGDSGGTGPRVNSLLLANSESAEVLIGTSEGLWQSLQGGARIESLSLGLPIRQIHALLRHSGQFWVGGVGGIYTSPSAELGSWRERAPGWTMDPLVVTTLVPTTQGVLVGTTIHGPWLVDDVPSWSENNDWIPVAGNLEDQRGLHVSNILFDSTRRATIYVATIGAGVFISEDAGMTWRSANEGLTMPFVYALSLGGGALPAIFAGTRDGLFRRAGPDHEWKRIALQGKDLRKLAVSPGQADVVFAGTWGTGLFRIEGGSPKPLEEFDGQLITSIVVHPQQADLLFVGTWGNGVFSTRNRGDAWMIEEMSRDQRLVSEMALASTGDLYIVTSSQLLHRDPEGVLRVASPETFGAVSCDPIDPTAVLVGTSYGGEISRRSGRGTSGKSLGAVLVGVTSIAMDPLGGRTVFVGTEGGGLFRGELDRGVGATRPASDTDAGERIVFPDGSLWGTILILVLSSVVGALMAYRLRRRSDIGPAFSSVKSSGVIEAEEDSNRPVHVFISHAHEDEPLCKELVEHLSLMRRQGLIKLWHDGRIMAGERWSDAIEKNLEEAEVVIFLVSADFLNSEFCMDRELPATLLRAESGKVQVVPLVVRPCDWQSSSLGRFQMLPVGGEPILSKKWDSRDEAFNDVTMSLRALVEEMREN